MGWKVRQLVNLVHVCVWLATWPFCVYNYTRNKKTEPPREPVGVLWATCDSLTCREAQTQRTAADNPLLRWPRCRGIEFAVHMDSLVF